MRDTQRGITLLGFIVVLGLIGFFAYVGMKLFPMYSEYYSVKSALKGLSRDQAAIEAGPARMQDLFFRRLRIDYTENVKPEHVKIRRADNGWQMDVQYEVRRPLIFNLDVVGKFHATQTLTRGGDGV
ncbi:DUF4845 domain-containing protein [Lysobacteraceae bacterium NML93-0399]|nr:DUF4845 domain-containing protein [Xanthomonadaceae bacterium NML93-0399]